MLSVSGERDVDVQNVLCRELRAFCALCTFYLVNFVGLLYPGGAMRHTTKLLVTIFNGEP